jgi:ribosomal-protein-alanine N-acetyltransferase
MRFFTERLLLRPINENDSAEMLGIRSNVEINQFLHRIPPKNTFEALEFILNIKRKTENSEIVFLGISLQNNPQ